MRKILVIYGAEKKLLLFYIFYWYVRWTESLLPTAQGEYVSFVVFENLGEIDVSSITTFGVSVKETENPIGYFGTGLKYAIAIILRRGCHLAIFSGKNTYNFKTSERTVRGEVFNIVQMNDKDMAFTTELGKNWELWQAFREVYCNCIDEKGKTYLSNTRPSPEEGKTFVVVEGDEFVNEFQKKGEVVLDLKHLLITSCEDGEIYDTPSNYIYYRGVRIQELSRRSLYTYNIKSKLDLSEDRSPTFSWEPARIAMNISYMCDDYPVINNILNAHEDSYEAGFSYDSSHPKDKASPAFVKALEKGFKMNKDSLNKTAVNWLILNTGGYGGKFIEKAKLNSVQEAQLLKCVKICTHLYPGFTNYEIVNVENLGESTMAMADVANGKIILSRECYEKGTKFLLSTIIEEFFHLKTGFRDCSRSLQTYLFDHVCTLIENHVLGEPV